MAGAPPSEFTFPSMDSDESIPSFVKDFFNDVWWRRRLPCVYTTQVCGYKPLWIWDLLYQISIKVTRTLRNRCFLEASSIQIKSACSYFLQLVGKSLHNRAVKLMPVVHSPLSSTITRRKNAHPCPRYLVPSELLQIYSTFLMSTDLLNSHQYLRHEVIYTGEWWGPDQSRRSIPIESGMAGSHGWPGSMTSWHLHSPVWGSRVAGYWP